jgi:hypothetical protein
MKKINYISLAITIDKTMTPVTPRLTHDTGPLFLVPSSFFARAPRLSGRGNFLSTPEFAPPLQDLTEPRTKRLARTELIWGSFGRHLNMVILIVTID